MNTSRQPGRHRRERGSGGITLHQSIGGYRITGEIGEGSMGKVYAAEHEVLGRQAAIKVLRPERARDPEEIHRFVQEAQAASAIDDPGIVKIFEVGEQEDGTAYLIMERLQGETLAMRLQREGPLGLTRARPFVVQIARALAAAHKRGIVHRDLKPENLFIARDPQVTGGERMKILDFGIAKVTGNLDVVSLLPGSPTLADANFPGADAILGSPAYMAPEQCRRADHVDHRADFYALGCILFEMLCGEPPFVRDNATAVMLAHQNDPPPAPSAAVRELVSSAARTRPDPHGDPNNNNNNNEGTATTRRLPPDAERITPQIDEIVLRLLAKNPDDRYQDVDSLMQDLATSATLRMGIVLSQTLGATTLFAGFTSVSRLFTTIVATPRRRPLVSFSALVTLAAILVAVAMAVGGGSEDRSTGDATAGMTGSGDDGDHVMGQPEPIPERLRPQVRQLSEEVIAAIAEASSDEEILAHVQKEDSTVTWVIESNPPGAAVFYENGQPVAEERNHTPLLLQFREKIPTYGSLLVRLEGHEEEEVDVRYDASSVERVKLVPIPRVTIRTEPTGATVFTTRDGRIGQQIDTTPWTTPLSRKARPRTFILQKDEYQDHTFVLDPRAGVPEVIRLEPLPRITVNSEPSGAVVFDDLGNKLGKTPWEELAPQDGQTMRRKLTMDRYEDQVITITGGEPLSEVFELVPIPRFTLETQPPGARILDLDRGGQEIGQTPYTVLVPRDARAQNLELVKDRHERQPFTIPSGDKLAGRRSVNKSVKLVPWATYQVRSNPHKVTIYDAEGTRLGDTPHTLHRSRADGPLELTLKRDGHIDASVTWIPGETPPGVIDLVPLVEIQIISSPSGSLVVNAQGEEVGRTPWSKRVPKSDEPLHFTVKRDGFESAAVKLVPGRRGDRARVKLREIPKLVTIEILSDPPGATVLSRKGEELGTTPFKQTQLMSDRRLEVVLTHERYKNKEISVRWDRSQTLDEVLEPCNPRRNDGVLSTGLVDIYACED